MLHLSGRKLVSTVGSFPNFLRPSLSFSFVSTQDRKKVENQYLIIGNTISTNSLTLSIAVLQSHKTWNRFQHQLSPPTTRHHNWVTIFLQFLSSELDMLESHSFNNQLQRFEISTKIGANSMLEVKQSENLDTWLAKYSIEALKHAWQTTFKKYHCSPYFSPQGISSLDNPNKGSCSHFSFDLLTPILGSSLIYQIAHQQIISNCSLVN